MTDKKRFVNVTDAACPRAASGLHTVHSPLWNIANIAFNDTEIWPCFAFSPPSLHVSLPEGQTPFLAHSPLLLASTSMADSRQPEDGAPQWDSSGGQESTGTHGANGYSSSAYRTCQPGAAHMTTASYSARENGFNGELTGAHAVTAGKTCLNILIFFCFAWQAHLECTCIYKLLKQDNILGQWVHSLLITEDQLQVKGKGILGKPFLKPTNES